MTSDPGVFIMAATGVACCAAGCILACALIAQFTREKPRRRETQVERDARELRSKVRAYEANYFDELAAAKQKKNGEDLTEEATKGLAAAAIEEETPVGLVRMEYDPERRTFDYYTDARNIGYKVLDAVARSFCLAHDCPQICVHYREEFERAKAKAIAERAETRRQADERKDDGGDEGPGCKTENSSVFAKFKTYNARASKPVKARPRILTENANRFAFKGTLKARDAERKAEEKKVKPTDPEFRFSDFKDKCA